MEVVTILFDIQLQNTSAKDVFILTISCFKKFLIETAESMRWPKFEGIFEFIKKNVAGILWLNNKC